LKKYYQILGLEEGVTLAEVEQKYRQLLLEFDPEKQEDDLKEFFKSEQEKVEEAYEKISLSFTNINNATENKKTVKKSSISSKSKVPNPLLIACFSLIVLILGIAYYNSSAEKMAKEESRIEKRTEDVTEIPLQISVNASSVMSPTHGITYTANNFNSCWIALPKFSKFRRFVLVEFKN
jgi:preprotein translocase subunit Sec63